MAGEVATRAAAQLRGTRLRGLRRRGAVGTRRPAGGFAIRRGRPPRRAVALGLRVRAASAPVSMTMSSAPTGTMSPGAPVVDSTRPLTGAGTSTAAFSVITSTITSSSATVSPGFTRQLTISASTVPSPRSGSLKT